MNQVENLLDNDAREIFRFALEEHVLTVDKLEDVIAEIKATIENSRYDLMNKLVRDCSASELDDARRIKLESIFHGDKDSSFIENLRYDNIRKNLLIEMTSGRYQYHGVPTNVAELFKTAESLGQCFNENIKGRYEVTKL